MLPPAGSYDFVAFIAAFALVPFTRRWGPKVMHAICLAPAGVLGIFNMFIVIPMMIQIFTLPLFYEAWLGGRPENVIRLAGVLLICAAVAALFVRLNAAQGPGPRRVVIGGVVAAMLLATACRDAAAPLPVAGTYVLREVDGRPLPAMVHAGLDTDPGDGEYRIFMAADTLRLAPEGHFARASRIFTVRPALADTATSDGYIEGTYTVEGDSISLYVLGRLQAAGHLRAGVIEVAETLFVPPASQLRYHRLP